ncbi:cupin domain-containing protein [Sphingomonas sp. RHCKR7]|nr:cupin domain-containing protein [Sphingomonas folli]
MERRTMLGLPLATLVGSTSLGEPAGAATPATAGMVRAGSDHDGRPHRIGVSATTYKAVTRETGGALFVVEQANQRRGGPPLHVHHGEDELFYVLAGDYIVQVGDRRYPLGAGDCILGPRGVPHAWAFVGAGTGRLLLSYAPAGKMEAFFNAWEQLGFTPGGYSQEKDAALLRSYGMERRGPPIVL